MGWHRDEFDFMGVPFERRGRRGDEAIRVLTLSHGEHDFEGRIWSFHDATAEPLASAGAGDLDRRQLATRRPARAHAR